MRRSIFLIIVVSLMFFQAISYAGVTVTASKTNIPRGQTNTVTLNYKLTNPYNPSCSAKSNLGEFVIGNTIIGTVQKTITINVAGNNATAVEVLNIPLSVTERAIKMRENKIEFRRNFLVLNCSSTYYQYYQLVSLIFYITTEAAAEFDIKRIELYFENGRAEITVPKNYKGLKAFADIKFTGSGLLRGYWEVDGRILSHVNQHITYGKTTTFQTPDIPPLPTFETGTHILRFVVTNPSVEIPLPSAIYFVRSEEVKEFLKINLLSPQNNSEFDYASQKFTWENLDGTMMYLVQFFENRDSKPIFSAYTKESYYNLPDSIVKKIFQQGKTYYWRVIGFDEKNNSVGESDIWKFSFRSQSFIPGHIIIALSTTDFSKDFIERLKVKYGLEIIEFFNLETLNTVVVLFKCNENILDKIELIKSEEKIILAQPNFIFQTLSEPLRKFQYALDIMKIEKIHNLYKGKGVKVAVIDTGVDYEHRDLKERVVLSKNFVRAETYKKEIHGTAVAGVIGASINGFGIAGVAPEAKIYSLRACTQIGDTAKGLCESFNILKALDEAIKRNIRVINMSFGSLNYDRLLSALIDKAVQREIFIVVPLSIIGNSITFPASHPDVISVGGMDEKENPYPSKDIVNKAKVLAPADKIITTFPDNRHNFISGTSLSSAYVSGLLALYIQMGDKRNLPSFKGDLYKWEKEIFGIFPGE